MIRNAVVAALAFAAAVGLGEAASQAPTAQAALQAGSELRGMAAQLRGGSKVDADTLTAEVEQLKALLSQIETDHGRQTPDSVVEKEAKGVLQTLEKAAGQAPAQEASEASEASQEAAAGAAESSEASEVSEASGAASEESSEASEAAEPKGASLAELHKELAELMVKKDSGAVSGEDLEALNVQIELVLNKIKAATAQKETPKDDKAEKKERNAVEQITDPLLAHLANLREHKGQFAGLHDVDVQDMAVNLRRLADLADAYRGGKDQCAQTDSCGNPVQETKPACPETGCEQEKKVLVEAEEKKCGDAPCPKEAAQQMTVVAATKCSNETKTKCEEPKKATVQPQVVDKCSNQTGACAAQSKSATSTCDACHQERAACHKTCEEDKCHDACHKAQDACHANKCGSSVARVDVVKPTSTTTETSKCEPTQTGACHNVKPTTVAKGALTDKKAFLFM